MELPALIFYGGINVAMVMAHLVGRGRFYRFPFWAGIIALGWFLPQAIGGYVSRQAFPPGAYTDGMLFASLCMAALWLGFSGAVHRVESGTGWLDSPFDLKRLYGAAALLCAAGFYFQWKLMSLPDEVLAETQWSGAAVKYLFFANVFKIGFICLWLIYLHEGRWFAFKYMIFLLPCLLLFLEAAVLRGRRAGMMDLVAYLLISLWFVRRKTVPRGLIVAGLAVGLVLINGIGMYREIMKEEELPLKQRLENALEADYTAVSEKWATESGAEFRNYIFYREVQAEEGLYDYGLFHWNRFVHNYVPAQLLGEAFKDSLEYESEVDEVDEIAEERYGHEFRTGSTVTGYKDAFGSFGWFGVIKFALIGALMGVLYRHAMQGAFLGQLLYVYAMTKAMQCVSHGSNDILIRIWIYFFVLCYPVLYLARRIRDHQTTLPAPEMRWNAAMEG